MFNSFESEECFRNIYRVIHKSLRDFRPLRYSSRDGHAEGDHVNRGRDIPSFCPTLQVLDMSTLGDAVDVNPVIKFLPHTCNVCGRNLFTGLYICTYVCVYVCVCMYIYKHIHGTCTLNTCQSCERQP